MNKEKLNLMSAGLLPWQENYGQGMERRGPDGLSWYDLSINLNSAPCEPDTVIILTAWMGQLKWLKSALESYRKSGAYVIMAYDNPFYAWQPNNPHEILRCMPNMTHYLLANSVVMKHITYDGDKRNGWFWSARYAQGLVKQFKNFKYVFITNGDCIWDRPEGLKDVTELLGEADLMSGQSNDNVVHTASVIFKVDAFHAIFDYMAGIMRVPILGSHSPEVMLREAIADLGLKVMHAPKQPLDPADGTIDMYARYDQASTWKELLGFKNLFAIYETQGNEGKEPLDKKYVDLFEDCLYFGGEEKTSICKFWETGDYRYLYYFWAIWEDSDYNRWYAPVEWYGDKPIYEKDNLSKYGRQI